MGGLGGWLVEFVRGGRKGEEEEEGSNMRE